MSRAQRLCAVVSVIVLAGLCALVGAPAAQAYAGAPWFKPSTTYTQNFPDPGLLRVGSTYYAYGTATGGAYLPVMSSPDMRTWTARPAYDPGAPLNKDPYFNDALPYPAAWGVDKPVAGRMKKTVWAPGVSKIGTQYVLFYTIQVSLSPERYCISRAVSSSPLGPFKDTSTAPVVCDPDPKGSIDPQPYVDPAGKVFLIWKSEGVPGSAPTKIWSRQLTSSGMGWAAGSVKKELLRTALSWEGNVIENPSMVRYGNATYLFYSANEWRSGSYRAGYAKCDSPLGPCRRGTTTPLMPNTSTQLSRAGGSAIVDASGRLRLGYHFWNAPFTNYPAYPSCLETSCTNKGQRRLGVVTLGLSSTGHLRVVG